MSNPHGDVTVGDKSVSVQGQNRSSDMSQIKVLRIVDPGEGWKADCGMDTTRLVITASEVNLQYAKNIPTVVRDHHYRPSLPSF